MPLWEVKLYEQNKGSLQAEQFSQLFPKKNEYIPIDLWKGLYAFHFESLRPRTKTQ